METCTVTVRMTVTTVGPPCDACEATTRTMTVRFDGPFPAGRREVAVFASAALWACAGCGRIITNERNEP